MQSTLKHAIIWPLVDDQSTFEPYLVSGPVDNFARAFRRELQFHVTEVINTIDFSDELVNKANDFVAYMPTPENTDDTKEAAKVFVELMDELSLELSDVERLSQWRIRFFN